MCPQSVLKIWNEEAKMNAYWVDYRQVFMVTYWVDWSWLLLKYKVKNVASKNELKRGMCLLPTWVRGGITLNEYLHVGSRRFVVPLFLQNGITSFAYYLRKELERTCQVQYRKSFNSTDEADSVPERTFLFQHDPTPARANAGWSLWRERLGEPCIDTKVLRFRRDHPPNLPIPSMANRNKTPEHASSTKLHEGERLQPCAANNLNPDPPAHLCKHERPPTK